MNISTFWHCFILFVIRQSFLELQTQSTILFRNVDPILPYMRNSLDPGTVASNQREQVRGFKKLFSSVTSTEILTFKYKNGKDIKCPFSLINDPQEFMSSIASTILVQAGRSKYRHLYICTEILRVLILVSFLLYLFKERCNFSLLLVVLN